MPTYDQPQRFQRDLENLDPAARQRFKDCVRKEFAPAISAGPPYPGGLRIKRVRGTPGVWEMTFAPNGRATFQFGEQVLTGEPDVVWRRVGTHDVLDHP